MKTNNYLPIIVSLRGLAALAVCMFHFTKDFVADDSITREVFRNGWMGVEVFFVISGFVIPFSLLGSNYSLKNYGSFLKKRLIRIEPAYLISVFLVIGLNFISTFIPGYAGKPFDLSFNLIFEHIGYLVRFFGNEWLNPVYWTLEIEFHYYLLVGLLIVIWNRRYNHLNIIIFLILLGSSLFLKNGLPFFRYADIFTLGILTAFYRREFIPKTKYLMFVIGISWIVFLNHGPIIVVLTFFTTILIAFFGNWGNYRFLIFFGNISYSIYLIHVPIGGRIINFAKRFNLSEIGQLGVILVALVISVLSAWSFYACIERPSHNWAKKIVLK